MSGLTMMKRFFGTFYLKSWCKNEAQCDIKQIKMRLMLWLAKFAFFSWLPDLPEEDFGTTLAGYVQDYLGEEGKEGFDTFVKVTLGDSWLMHFHLNDYQMTLPHPSNLMQIFVPYSLFNPLVDLNSMPRNVPRLAKLLLYKGFVESVAKRDGISVRDVVKKELANYPYTVKDNFTVGQYNFCHIVEIVREGVSGATF